VETPPQADGVLKIIIIELSPEDYSYEFFNEAMVAESRGSWAKQGAYTAAWKYLILVQIMKHINKHAPKNKSGDAKKIYTYLRDKHRDTERNPIAVLISYLKRIEAIKIGKYEAGFKATELEKLYKLEEINKLIPAIINLCKKLRIFVLIDDLDLGWDASEDSKAFVAGLVQAALSISQYSHNLRVLVSLRRELFDNIPSLYTEAEKYRDETEKLNWDASSLFKLITNRIRYRVPGLIKSDDTRCWNCVFHEFSKNGGLSLFDYIIDRTLYRPREIIQFCSKALEIAHDNQSWPIDSSIIREAEFEYSKERVDDISAEYRFQYPGLWSIFEVFRGSRYELHHDALINICLETSCGELRVDKSAEWVIDIDPEKLVEILWKIGFLQAASFRGSDLSDISEKAYYGSHQIPHMNINNVESFQVHPMFRKYLNI